MLPTPHQPSNTTARLPSLRCHRCSTFPPPPPQPTTTTTMSTVCSTAAQSSPSSIKTWPTFLSQLPHRLLLPSCTSTRMRKSPQSETMSMRWSECTALWTSTASTPPTPSQLHPLPHSRRLCLLFAAHSNCLLLGLVGPLTASPTTPLPHPACPPLHRPPPTSTPSSLPDLLLIKSTLRSQQLPLTSASPHFSLPHSIRCLRCLW